jgi:pyruvate, water dikinase
MPAVAWFEGLTAQDVPVAGGKGANLGELTAAGFPVPPGFVVTAAAFLDAMAQGGVRAELAAAAENLDIDDPDALAERAERLQNLVVKAGLPPALRAEVVDAYHALAARLGRGSQPAVAVRSSATAEDAADTSFAGMNRTITNVVGVEDLCESVVACWASLFAERVIAYRAACDVTAEPAIATVVQAMVPVTRSGVIFTADPASGDRSVVVIEAAVGQGEVVVSGQVEPDTYVVGKEPLRVIHARIGHQSHKIVRGPDGRGDLEVELSPEEQQQRVLSTAEVLDLARLAVKVEQHYGAPQDMEWCFDDDEVIHLVQSRPITTLDKATGTIPAAEATVLVRGLGATPGMVAAKARLLASPKDGRQLEAGEILVATMTNPDWLPTLRRAGGIVTDGGGLTCHAAIVSRELGKPCVVGTRHATTSIATGDFITVDGTHGLVYAGDQVAAGAQAAVPMVSLRDAAAPAVVAGGPETTATLLYVNLALAEHAEEVAAQDVDGVGLLRAEFLLTEALDGRHPRHVLATGGAEEFVDRMVASLITITRAFQPRPVVYRTIDCRSNEFSGLEGGAGYEPVENNPMIGYRGCYRYVKEPDLFGLECEVLSRVREETPNLHVMIPFVRTKWELEACLELIDASPLGRQRGLHRWVMAEVPSVVYWLPEYVGMGIDGVSIGSNDLTQLMLGVDRDSEVCAPLFAESDGAVLDAIGSIVETGRRLGITTSLCGQAPSNNPAFAEHLVRYGITSVSVDPSAATRTRRALASAERRLLLEAARRS